MKVGQEPRGTNDHQSRMFAHAAFSYWNIASALNDTSSHSFNLWDLMFGGVPIMHMALELAVKAMIMISDEDFIPRKAGHDTPQIIQDYIHIVPIGLIGADVEKMDLIKELHSAWSDLRYAGGTLEYESQDTKNFDEIMDMLLGEYKKLSGLRTL